MEILEHAERAARLLVARSEGRSVDTLEVERAPTVLRLTLLRRRGRATVRARQDGACARIRLPWGYSETELVDALVEVFVLAARRHPGSEERLRERALTAQRRAAAASAAASREREARNAERARADSLALLMRQRLERVAAERERLRAERETPRSVLGRVLGALRRQ